MDKNIAYLIFINNFKSFFLFTPIHQDYSLSSYFLFNNKINLFLILLVVLATFSAIFTNYSIGVFIRFIIIKFNTKFKIKKNIRIIVKIKNSTKPFIKYIFAICPFFMQFGGIPLLILGFAHGFSGLYSKNLIYIIFSTFLFTTIRFIDYIKF